MCIDDMCDDVGKLYVRCRVLMIWVIVLGLLKYSMKECLHTKVMNVSDIGIVITVWINQFWCQYDKNWVRWCV